MISSSKDDSTLQDYRAQTAHTNLFHKSMSPSQPVTSRHGTNRCILFTCRRINEMTQHSMESCCIKLQVDRENSSTNQPSCIKRGYTKLAGLKVVSWNAALNTGDLRLRRGRLLSGCKYCVSVGQNMMTCNSSLVFNAIKEE